MTLTTPTWETLTQRKTKTSHGRYFINSAVKYEVILITHSLSFHK